MMEIRELSNELLEVSKKELHEVPEKLIADIESLRNWMNQNPHLRLRSDTQFLVAFLRGCKFNLDKVKQKLELFYTVRQNSPEIMAHRYPNDLNVLAMIRQGFGLPLSLLATPASPRVILVRPGIFDPKFHSIQDAMKVTTMILDIMLNEDDNFVVAGQVCVLDLSGVTIKHFTQYNPMLVKKMMTITQDACPGRLKGLHWINCPKGFETVFNLFTVFMNEKNRSRVFVHNSYESLYQYIPKRLLPQEYGGEAGEIKTIIAEWEKRIKSYEHYYKEEDKFGVVEKLKHKNHKKPNIPEPRENFRQLDFD